MVWTPEWLGRSGRPIRDLNTKEMELYRAEVDQIRLECVPLDEGHRYTWVWRDAPTPGSRLLTPVFAGREYATQQYPGCSMGMHPVYGMSVFWNDSLFLWRAATEEELAKDAVVGGFLAFGQEVAEDDPRLVLMHPERFVSHQTAGHLSQTKRTAGLFPPRADSEHIWVLETKPTQTWVRRYPLSPPEDHGPEEEMQDARNDPDVPRHDPGQEAPPEVR